MVCLLNYFVVLMVININVFFEFSRGTLIVYPVIYTAIIVKLSIYFLIPGSTAVHRGPADPNFREKTVAKARRNSSILMDEGVVLDLASVS